MAQSILLALLKIQQVALSAELRTDRAMESVFRDLVVDQVQVADLMRSISIWIPQKL